MAYRTINPQDEIEFLKLENKKLKEKLAYNKKKISRKEKAKKIWNSFKDYIFEVFMPFILIMVVAGTAISLIILSAIGATCLETHNTGNDISHKPVVCAEK